ncbi:MAG: hypothetical protein C6I00_04970 [Nitratiruptor sp.]|nr:hypothetical protein [Nitratiruptor sp.]NPA84262.1 hypothetical protein [Campylobacterota bacterium]
MRGPLRPGPNTFDLWKLVPGKKDPSKIHLPAPWPTSPAPLTLDLFVKSHKKIFMDSSRIGRGFKVPKSPSLLHPDPPPIPRDPPPLKVSSLHEKIKAFKLPLPSSPNDSNLSYQIKGFQ